VQVVAPGTGRTEGRKEADGQLRMRLAAITRLLELNLDRWLLNLLLLLFISFFGSLKAHYYQDVMMAYCIGCPSFNYILMVFKN